MADDNPRRSTPWGLVGLCAIAGSVAAILGTMPLAGWLDTLGTNQDSAALRDVASAVQAAGARTGLDQPYRRVQQAIRAIEGVRFSDDSP